MLPPFLPSSTLATSQATQDTQCYSHSFVTVPGFSSFYSLGCCHYFLSLLMLPQLSHPLSGCLLSDSLSCLGRLRCIFSSPLALMCYSVFLLFLNFYFFLATPSLHTPHLLTSLLIGMTNNIHRLLGKNENNKRQMTEAFV